MVAITIVVELAKSVFEVHGVDGGGRNVLRRGLSRGRLLDFFATLPPCRIAMEACASQHHWARELVLIPVDAKRKSPKSAD